MRIARSIVAAMRQSDRSLRVAILAPESLPRTWGAFSGGITQYVSAMARGYADLGHEVDVFARGHSAEELATNGAALHFTAMAGDRGSARVVAPLVDEVRTQRAFSRASRSGRFDAVEVIDWSVPALLALATVNHGP